MPQDDQPILDQHRVWDDWAKADPLWAIVSDPTQKGGKWDVEEFFATGRADVQALQREVADLGLQPGTGRCLDFGCGVGRLTQSLAEVFDRADGLDISETMIDLARGYNRHGERCVYQVNVAPDLRVFADNTFDLIFTTMVLQHNPPDIARGYIAEFARILVPGGLAVFDMPAAFVEPETAALEPGSHRAELRIERAPDRLEAGTSATAEVTVINVSGTDWPAKHRVRLGNHWLARDGSTVAHDDGRTGWSGGLAAGASITLEIAVRAPAQRGRYRLAFDLVEEGVSWFADLGSSAVSAPVRVTCAGGWPARLGMRSSTSVAPVVAEPAPFTMDALRPDEVAAAVAEHGGRVAHSRPVDSAGPEWETYRYFVQKPTPMVGA